MNQTTRLPFRVKVGYGAAELPNSLTWTMFYVLFLFFLTDVVRIEPAMAGFIMMLGTLWDAVTDPGIGIISDRSKSKFGRRRPFILGVAIPFGIITWLLFTDFGFGPKMTMAYFIIVVLIYFTIFTVLDVPYTSLAAEMTQDYDERTSLISFRAVFCQIASILGAALPLVLVQWLNQSVHSLKISWSVVCAIFGFIAIFPILWTWRATRGYELFPESTTVKLKDIPDAVFKNRTFRYTVGVYVFSNVGMGVAGAVMVYFMKYFMNFNETQESIAFLFLFACTIFWIPVINMISARHGKRWAFMIFIGLWAIIQSVGVMLVRPDTVVFFYILIILASGGLIGVTMAGWSMIPDVIEVDEFKSGQRREGLYFGVISFSRKISVAIALWLVGIFLSRIGYVPDAQQTDSAIFGIRILYAEGTAVFLFISIILAYLLPMNKQKHQALREAIELKKAGQQWDAEAIKDIL
ncbi:MAG: MFS transporter [Deltaproteobacteria bacterium]|nr:MFS transporter [Deltaproteobacteria bacterium]